MGKMKLSDIKVDDRFRKDFGDIEELAKSIEQHGLIQPLVVHNDGTLIAGERRYRACKLLGKEEVEIRTLNDLTSLERKELELEENLHRKAFTWDEEVKAKEEIHKIKQLQYGERVKGHESNGWGVKDTAEVLDESLGTVSQDIKLAQALDKYPELKDCKNKTSAWKELKKIEERQTLEAMAALVGNENIDDLYEVHNCDTLDWLAECEDESVDLIIADPPWGIEMDTKSRMSRDTGIEYDDSLDTALALMNEAVHEFYRVLKNDRHLYVYFGIANYQIFKDLLEQAGFEVDPVPVIYNKDRGGSAAKGKTFPKAYETIFHCWKGSRELKITHHNVFTEQRPEGKIRIHSAQKAISMQEHLIEASSDPGEIIFIPFMGSGSGVVAAVNKGRKVIGCEIDNVSYASAVNWIENRLKGE